MYSILSEEQLEGWPPFRAAAVRFYILLRGSDSRKAQNSGKVMVIQPRWQNSSYLKAVTENNVRFCMFKQAI